MPTWPAAQHQRRVKSTLAIPRFSLYNSRTDDYHKPYYADQRNHKLGVLRTETRTLRIGLIKNMRKHAQLINKFFLAAALCFGFFTMTSGPETPSQLDPQVVERINNSNDLKDVRGDAKALISQLQFAHGHNISFTNLLMLFLVATFGVAWMNVKLGKE